MQQQYFVVTCLTAFLTKSVRHICYQYDMPDGIRPPLIYYHLTIPDYFMTTT